jgi:hypothetical protein
MKNTLFAIMALMVLMLSMTVSAAPTWPPTWSVVGSAGGGTIAVANASLMYFGAGASGSNVFKSTDGGVTRSSSIHSACLGTPRIATSEDGQYVYETCLADGSAYRSDDYGATWSSNLAGSDLYMNIDTSNSGQYVIALAPTGNDPGDNRLAYYSNDYGVTWSELNDTLGSDGGGVCMTDDGTMIIVTTTSTWKSINHGSSWTTVGSGTTLSYNGYFPAWEVACSNDGQRLFAVPGAPGTGYPADTDYLAYSFDGGANWAYYGDTFAGKGVSVATNTEGTYGAFSVINTDTSESQVIPFNVSGGTLTVSTSGTITDASGENEWGVGFTPDDSLLFISKDAQVQSAETFTPCSPDWVCSGYDSCLINDTQVCNAVTDNNTCGVSYTGDYSEFSAQSCDYCTPSWICDGYAACAPNDEQACNSTIDANGCYAITNLTSDQYSGNLSEFNATVCDYCTPSWSCSYQVCLSSNVINCTAVSDNNTCSEAYTGNYSEFAVACEYNTFSASTGGTSSSASQTVVEEEVEVAEVTSAPSLSLLPTAEQDVDLAAWIRWPFEKLWSLIGGWFING